MSSSFEHKESLFRVLAKIKHGVVQISMSTSYMPLKVGLYQKYQREEKDRKKLPFKYPLSFVFLRIT